MTIPTYPLEPARPCHYIVKMVPDDAIKVGDIMWLPFRVVDEHDEGYTVIVPNENEL